MGDSLLKGTKGLICCLDATHREVCGFLGAWVRDIVRNATHLVWPSDYYLLLFFQAVNDEVARRSPRAIKRNFRSLRKPVKGSEAQTVFASVLPVGGINGDRQTWLSICGFETGTTDRTLGLLITGRFM